MASADCTADLLKFAAASSQTLRRPIFTQLQPAPDKTTCCGLPTALSLMETSALRPPRAAGLKVTEMVQELPVPSDVPQVLV
jgi:hypothetical protein